MEGVVTTPLIGQEWSFEVPGTPEAQGSLSYKGMRKTKDGRQVPIIIASNDRALKAWREAVGWAAKGATIAEAGHLQPIEIECIFRRPRASSNRGTYPVMPPDVDKLLRAILDALKGIAYHDDSQVVSIRGAKEYGPARAEVTVRWLGQLI